MPTFDTPLPIITAIDFAVGDISVIATDRLDTRVEVQPSDPSHDNDVRAAGLLRIDHSEGRLLIRSGKQRGLGLFTRPGSVDLLIELPHGSRLDVQAGVASLRTTGRLDECLVRTGVGDLRIDQVQTLVARTDSGEVAVDEVLERADVRSGNGSVRVGRVGGPAVLRSDNGDCRIDQADSDLRIDTANGDVQIGTAGAGVRAATANGSVTVNRVLDGPVSLKTAHGDIEIGLRPGVPAKLEVRTSFGRIRNEMDSITGPAASAQFIDVHAHTGYGDVVIRRVDRHAPTRTESS